MVDSVPAELLELQTRFETWRANRFVRQVSKRYLSSSSSAGMVEFMNEPPKIEFEIGGEDR